MLISRFATACIVVCAVAFAPNSSADAPQAPNTPGQTIVLISALESELTHTHMGATAFGNEERLLANEWGLAAVFADYAQKQLIDAGYSVERVDPPAQIRAAIVDGSFMKMGWSKASVRPSHAAWFKDEMQKHGATVVVVVKSYGLWFMSGKTPTYKGYGLHTLFGDTPKQSYLHANIGAFAIYGDKLVEARTSRAVDLTCEVAVPFERFGKSNKDGIDDDALLPFRDTMRRIGERSIRLNLTDAGLLRGPLPECDIQLPPSAS